MADDLRAVNPRARLFRIILSVYGVGIYIFLFAPIAVLILLSFNSSNVVGFPMAGFTTDWYARLPTGHRHSRCAEQDVAGGLLGDRAFDAHRDHGSVSAGACQHQESRRRACVHHAADHDAGSAHRCGHPGTGLQCAAHPALTESSDHRQTVLATPFVILVVSSRLEALDRNFERAAADLGAGPRTATSVRRSTAGLSGHHRRRFDCCHPVLG